MAKILSVWTNNSSDEREKSGYTLDNNAEYECGESALKLAMTAMINNLDVVLEGTPDSRKLRIKTKQA